MDHTVGGTPVQISRDISRERTQRRVVQHGNDLRSRHTENRDRHFDLTRQYTASVVEREAHATLAVVETDRVGWRNSVVLFKVGDRYRHHALVGNTRRGDRPEDGPDLPVEIARAVEQLGLQCQRLVVEHPAGRGHAQLHRILTQTDAGEECDEGEQNNGRKTASRSGHKSTPGCWADTHA